MLFQPEYADCVLVLRRYIALDPVSVDVSQRMIEARERFQL